MVNQYGSYLFNRVIMACRDVEASHDAWDWGEYPGSLFERLIGGCCLRLRSLADFRERPDMADDAFLLAGRGLAYCPSIVLTPAVLPRLIDCAVAGILVQHRSDTPQLPLAKPSSMFSFIP